jgi:Na+/phosphate symporter
MDGKSIGLGIVLGAAVGAALGARFTTLQLGWVLGLV